MVSRTHSDDWPSESVNFKVDLLCEECVMTRGRLPGGGGSSVVGKRETRLYEPEERLHSSSQGVKTGAFCSASSNASE